MIINSLGVFLGREVLEAGLLGCLGVLLLLVQHHGGKDELDDTLELVGLVEEGLGDLFVRGMGGLFYSLIGHK